VAVIFTVLSMVTIEEQLTPLLDSPDQFSDFTTLGAS
jgi:hypothetical protein